MHFPNESGVSKTRLSWCDVGQPTEVVKKLHTAIPNDTRKMFSLDAMPLVPFSFLSDDQWQMSEYEALVLALRLFLLVLISF